MPRKVNQYFHTLIGYHTSREVKNHWHTLALFSRQLLLIICMCTLWKNLRICCLDLHDSKTKPVSWKQWTYCRCGSLVQQVPMYLIVEMQWPRFEADLQPFAVCPPLLILPFSVCFSMQNCQIKAKKPQNKSSFKKRIYSKSKNKQTLIWSLEYVNFASFFADDRFISQPISQQISEPPCHGTTVRLDSRRLAFYPIQFNENLLE